AGTFDRRADNDSTQIRDWTDRPLLARSAPDQLRPRAVQGGPVAARRRQRFPIPGEEPVRRPRTHRAGRPADAVLTQGLTRYRTGATLYAGHSAEGYASAIRRRRSDRRRSGQ